ncbi:hypothetical protein AGMMS49938_15290 [Fibrobacterales bacterium]|nr:hypothetical protein AGMMS49938_15290 [Fibrobacterales bacterium]
MDEIELIQLVQLAEIAILWSIAGLAFIGAVNSRGVLRVPVSWLLAIAITIIALFFSYLKFTVSPSQIFFSQASQQQTVREPQRIEHSAGGEAVAASGDVQQDKANLYAGALGGVLRDAVETTNSILTFPKWDVIAREGVEKRESFESRALSLRNKSADIYRQIKNLNPPEQEKSSYDLLLVAADNLRLAGYEVHHQFGLEGAGNATDTGAAAEKAASKAKAVFTQILGTL